LRDCDERQRRPPSAAVRLSLPTQPMPRKGWAKRGDTPWSIMAQSGSWQSVLSLRFRSLAVWRTSSPARFTDYGATTTTACCPPSSAALVCCGPAHASTGAAAALRVIGSGLEWRFAPGWPAKIEGSRAPSLAAYFQPGSPPAALPLRSRPPHRAFGQRKKAAGENDQRPIRKRVQ
jgi:hypothetical protein